MMRQPPGMARFAATHLRQSTALLAPHSARPAVACSSALRTPRRHFLSRFFKRDKPAAIPLDEKVYDKQNVHYTGKLFGLDMDSLVYYLKLNGGIFAVGATIYLFFKASMYFTQFSLQTMGKLGFMSGFGTCFACYWILNMMKRRYSIPPNAVYNQAIAMAMKNPRVVASLGQYPKTGNFRAYCSSGGFKLPLLRRIRSGSYELADLLGTKPRTLQMMFVLRSADGKEGLVSCEVRKADGTLLPTNYYFHSLAVHIHNTDTKESDSIVLIGNDSDVVYQGIMKF